MEYKNLGRSGLKVPVLSFGTATFGGTNEFFKRWGNTNIEEAARLIDICFEHGVNFFDTANVYSQGDSELILGRVLKSKRDKSIISTKAGFMMGSGPNDTGSSRYHLIKACEESLRRLDTDYIDVYFIHGFDNTTPIEETLTALNHLVATGKVRYIGCSNFAAWQLMKSLSISEKNHLEKFVVYQGYYSLIGRDYEQELMPLLEDQGLTLMVWSPLGWGRLTGKIKRNQQAEEGRIKSGGQVGGPPVSDEYFFTVMDALEEISRETGKSISQISINWLLQNRTVSSVVIGARTEKQLIENLGSVGWGLEKHHLEKLNKVSHQSPIYPHWVGSR